MELNYCPACATPLTKENNTEYVCGNGHPYWNEPRASADVVFLDDGRVLLARRGIEPRKGRYTLPGGFLHFSEVPEDAARREAAEETGLTCGDLTLIGVYNVTYAENEASLAIVYLAREWTGTPRAGDDAAALTWEPVDVIDSEEFAWPMPGLADVLQGIAAGRP